MNTTLISLEIAVAVLGLSVLLLDLWTPVEQKRVLGHGAAGALAILLLLSFSEYFAVKSPAEMAFGGAYVFDGLALFFKRFFLVAAIVVLVMAAEFADRIATGISEFYSLVLFALTGMMFAASANNFMTLFVSIELITVTFYVLVSFQRTRTQSLEAGVKYLILGALSSGFLVYGIALIYGATGTMSFDVLKLKLETIHELNHSRLLHLGLLMVFAGLAFKMAVFPFQVWAPDVYQGAPAPTVAFLAVGSKAAGVVLFLRLMWGVLNESEIPGPIFEKLLMAVTAVTILYGSLCAIPQRNLKRLLGYSSIASAGYLMLGFAVMNAAGFNAILYYLGGYLFTVLGAFAVVCVVIRVTDTDDIASLAGLSDRSPMLAVTLTLAMVSLAGVPPLAGFLGKFMIFKSTVEEGMREPAFFWLLGVAVFGVVVSLYYYFGVVRAIWWSKNPATITPIELSQPTRWLLGACVVGMLWLGMFPAAPLALVDAAFKTMK